MNTSIQRPPLPEQLNTLKRLGSATVHEAQDQAGALVSAVKPIDPSSKLAGPALTVDAPPGDNLIVHYALTRAGPGDVLVVNAGGYLECGIWGEILTLAAIKIGLAGVIIDGAVRDAENTIALGFPVFARGLSIKGSRKGQPGRINIAISCAGVLVQPGDIVLGDRDGVVVVPRLRFEEVIAVAEKRDAAERALRQGIRAGRSTVELLQLSSELERNGIK